jgi:TIR domain
MAALEDSIQVRAPQIETARPCLFLSHAGIDSAAAVALAERLEQSPEAQRHGLTVWVDKREHPSGLQPGTPWQEQLEAAIQERSTAFAIYLTNAGAQNWVRMEVRTALDRAISAERAGESYPFIPIIAESGVEVELLPAFARQFQGIHLADADAVQKLIGAMLDRPAATVALVDEPFRGLEAFGAKDAHLFFGRERETEDVIERLKQTTLVMVVGDSGAGKSSLVKAGLVPAFREGSFAPRLGPRPDPALWHVVEMRPLGDPFDSLIKGISDAARGLKVNAELLSGAFKLLREQDATALRDALREGAPPDAQILLVVDQFEELWTLAPERKRNAFLDGLLDMARPDDPSRRVVMTIRRDYYNLCSTHEKFFARIENNDRCSYYNLRRMDDEALRACIERPLALAGVPAADARRLADEVLRDAGDQPGDLALIEMALTGAWQAWRERSNHHGDLIDSYIAIGRVEGAIRNAADEVYAALDQRQPLAEPLFMRLVQLGDTGGTTRRIVHAQEFAPEVWKLAQDLGSKDGKRLLVLGRGEASETAELAHEQLVTQWPQYQRWLQGSETDPRAADKRMLDQLMEQAGRWRQRGRKWTDLATGSALSEYRSLTKRRMSWLAPIEASFVGRSRVRRQLTRASIAAALVAVLGTGTWAFFDQRRQRIEAVATSISLQLELPEGEVERRDAEALIMLAGASGDERRAFVDELFKRSSLADRFARNPAAVTRALVGLDPAARREIIAHTFGPGSVTPDEADGRYARALLGIELATPAATEVVLAAIQESEGRLFVHPDIPSYRADPLRARGRAFAELAAGLTAEQARQAIGAMLAAIQGETHPSALGPLSQGLAALPVELTPDQAGQALDAILAEMERTWDSDAPRAFGEGLAALAADLNPYQAGQALEAVLAKMEGGSSREPPRSRRY